MRNQTKSNSSYSKEIAIAKALALKAGKIMLKYFDGDQKVYIKSDNTPVTVADISINKLVIKELKKAFPKDGIIGEEESTTEYGQGRKWFCDPIDGTAGYTWGTPTAMFSLSLVIDGKSVVGVAYDPFLKKLYYGIKGKGSFCNGKKLKVSDIGLNGGIMAVTGSAKLLNKLEYISDLIEEKVRLATFSGAVYKSCLVAKGRLVAFVEHGLNAHDIAAIHVIVEEAGGIISGLKGEVLDYSKPFKGAVVTNKKTHKKVVEIIKKRS